MRSCKGDGKSGSETAENRLWVTGKIRGWILGRVKNLWEDGRWKVAVGE